MKYRNFTTTSQLLEENLNWFNQRLWVISSISKKKKYYPRNH